MTVVWQWGCWRPLALFLLPHCHYQNLLPLYQALAVGAARLQLQCHQLQPQVPFLHQLLYQLLHLLQLQRLLLHQLLHQLQLQHNGRLLVLCYAVAMPELTVDEWGCHKQLQWCTKLGEGTLLSIAVQLAVLRCRCCLGVRHAGLGEAGRVSGSLAAPLLAQSRAGHQALADGCQMLQ